jgi:outer membrane protein TolC
MESYRVALDLERARLNPQLDVRAQVSRDIGEGDSSLPGTVYDVGLYFSMPLALRTARGRVRAAEARLDAQRESLRLMEDSLRMELLDIASAYQAAAERYEVLESLNDTMRRLAEAERRRFELGDTTLLVVNMREQSLGEASMDLVQAVSDLWDKYVSWQAATRCQ